MFDEFAHCADKEIDTATKAIKNSSFLMMVDLKWNVYKIYHFLMFLRSIIYLSPFMVPTSPTIKTEP